MERIEITGYELMNTGARDPRLTVLTPVLVRTGQPVGQVRRILSIGTRILFQEQTNSI